MENEKMQTKPAWGVVVTKGLAAGIICCVWWINASLFTLAVDRGCQFWLSMCIAALLTALILCIKGFRGWWISSGIAAAILWGCIYLYPSFSIRFLDGAINAKHISYSSLYSYILIFLGRDINTKSLYYTYQSVYFLLFFSLTWVWLFLIWLARMIYMLQFRKGNIN